MYSISGLVEARRNKVTWFCCKSSQICCVDGSAAPFSALFSENENETQQRCVSTQLDSVIFIYSLMVDICCLLVSSLNECVCRAGGQ